VVLREVARRAGVSHNAAYRHFTDRDELLAAVSEYGMAELADAMAKRVKAVRAKDPVERARRRLREVGRAYVHFALGEPGLFEVAFSAAAHPEAPPVVEARRSEAGEPRNHPPAVEPVEALGPYELLGRTLDELVEVGGIPAAHRPGADVVCWAGVHGFAKLHLDGPLQGTPAKEREQQLDQMLLILDLGLR
jgi:AcrR family transcriptional regulator